jgi:hypothetical protein
MPSKVLATSEKEVGIDGDINASLNILKAGQVLQALTPLVGVA